MQDKLELLLNKINYDKDKYILFKDSELGKIVISTKEETTKFLIILNRPLPLEEYLYFGDVLKKAYPVIETREKYRDYKVKLILSIKNVDYVYFNEYYEYFLSSYIKTTPSLKMFSSIPTNVVDGVLAIDVNNKAEKMIFDKVNKELTEKLYEAGFDIKFKLNINKDNNKVSEEIKEEKEKIAETYIPPVKEEKVEEAKPKYPTKKKVNYKRDGIVSISSINQDENSVELEAYIFDASFDTLKKKDGGEFYLVTLKISDNTSSILAKCFAKDEDDLIRYSKELKKGNWYYFKGQVRLDNYAHDYVFQLRSYEQIDSPVIERKDEEKEKRVELHAHTMMSQMDGVIDEVALVNQAIKWGHAGVAITDHDGVQAFPHVFDVVTKYNKDKKKEIDKKIKENEESIEEIKKTGNEEGIKELEKIIEELKEEKKNYKPFKAGYGVELELCESFLNVCFNPNKEKVKGNTYVVFDTETTGFNPGLGDSIIEIGGVKVCNGEVIDRFDELINPGCHIDESITRLTGISDDDVKDSLNEEEAIKKFKEWIGTYPLVAHNARFDKNMLDMAYYKYDLGKLENPIIDTLMLSRVINRDLKKHSLKALGKNYGIDTGEEDEEVENEDSQTIINDPTIKSIKVDGVDILKTRTKEVSKKDIATETTYKSKTNEYYIDTIYKPSKANKISVVIENAEDTYENEYKLHPALNTFNIKYYSGLEEFTITINVYVGKHHGADVDSENTAYIFSKMLNQVEGIKKIEDFNNLALLEELAFDNNPKYRENIGDLCTYKNYIRPVLENEELPDDTKYPFSKYNNKDYVWKFPLCDDDNLQMYENIPGKTKTENIANIYDNLKHVTLIAKNKTGLKNIFKLVSFANTNFLDRNAKIPRKLINEYRDGILVGSACLNGEIFYIAETRSEEDLMEAMKFYDYIEVQPINNYIHLLKRHDINNIEHLKKCLIKIINCAKKINKLIVATGDVHNLNKDDLIYREIIVNQNVPGKGRHQLARYLGTGKFNLSTNIVDSLIKKANVVGNLEDFDITVLKYIYALAVIKKVPLTENNLNELFMLEKDSSIKAEDKLAKIHAALSKLETAKVISFDSNNNEYKLLSEFDKELPEMTHIPNQFFRTTKEMKDEFAFLEDEELINEIVVVNPNKIIDAIEEIEVIVYPEKPYSPIIENSQETCRDLVFEKAHSMYGDPLPRNIEVRIAEEFYGDKITKLVKDKMDNEYPDMSEEEKEEKFSSYLHEKIMGGYNAIVELKKEEVLREEPDLDNDKALEKAKLQLTGIIGGGFDVIYLIAQKLVKHSNDDGYLVGSRGSVGSSFVASMMGITECNGLPAHYYCPKCHHNEFVDENGVPYSENYPSGFDLPNKECPECKTLMVHQGNDMPFATFLGFAGEKVPDIDLNFSGDNQASAHEYTKVLFGTDNVYRAGTIGTVADKTAFGYVQGYFEEVLYGRLKSITDSLNLKIPSKDDLKKKGVIKSDVRTCEVERLAVGCTGVKRTTGQHPGGIVVVPGYKDVWDFTPFQYPADDPSSAWRTTHFDYHKIEADLLKLDILGHDDPTVLRMLQDLSGIDVTTIDLGDLDTMKIFTGPEVLGVNRNDLRGLNKDGVKYCPTGTLGVPEFGTSFLLGMLEETKPTTFAELIKISGLSHGTDVWLGNARDLCTPDKNGNIQVPFKNVIGCRDDIMVNLMQWGLPAGKAFKIMEFVRKGKPSKDPEAWKEHATYMREHNIPEWYIESCRKIKYMFPKAHATAYVTSAFRIAWFKVHHPILYYCAYLSIRRDQFDISAMIGGAAAIRSRIDEIDAMPNPTNKEIDTRETLCLCLEMCLRGFYFKNIDIEKSDGKKFVITDDKKGLIIPFRALDGLGDNVAEQIIKARNESPFMSQEDLMSRGKVNKTALEKLRLLGALDNLPESNQLSLFDM